MQTLLAIIVLASNPLCFKHYRQSGNHSEIIVVQRLLIITKKQDLRIWLLTEMLIIWR